MSEYKRSRGRKKVILPSGEEIYIPVLTGISVIDPRDRYQEHQYSIDNSDQADRVVHIDTVYPTVVDQDGKPTDDPPIQDTTGEGLKVERIDTWKVVDPRNRYQESHVEFDNNTGADSAPPRFTNHQKTSVYRCYQDPTNPDDDGPWIDSELMDELGHVDSRSRYQETVLSLNNPTNAEFREGDISGQASADDPDLTIGDGEGGADIPVRTDPFQNIINYNDILPPYLYLSVSLSYTNMNTAPAPIDSGVSKSDPCPGLNIIGPGSGPGGSGDGYQAFPTYLESILFGSPIYYPSNGPDISYDPLTTITFDIFTWLVTYSHPMDPRETTGDPLFVNGKEILGYLDTLQVGIGASAWHYSDVSDQYYFAGTVNWMHYLAAPQNGVWDAFGEMTPYSEGWQKLPRCTATISSDPFSVTNPFTGGIRWWQAVGVRNYAAPYNKNPANMANPSSPDYIPGYKDYGDIYCIKTTAP